MTLKAMLDTLDGLDEALHALYEQDEKSGKFLLQVDGAETLPAVRGLADNKDAILAEKRKLQAELEKLKGVDPEEYEALKKAQEAAERERLEKKGEFDKILEQTAAKHQAALAARDAREASLVSKLEELMIDAEATKIITSEEFKGSPTLLMPHIRKRVQVKEVDGQFQTIVLAADQKTPLVSSGSGDRATLKDLVSEFRDNETFGAAFGATGGSGSGAKPPAGGGGGKKPNQVSVNDKAGFSANLDDIAAGKVQVVQ